MNKTVGYWYISVNLWYVDMLALECWSSGVLGLKAEMDLIFALFPLVIQDPNMVCILQLYQPFINPLLLHSSTPSSIHLLL